MTGLAFSCLHFPYHHHAALDFLRDLRNDYRPDYVVNLGDEFDLYRASRFSHSPGMLTLEKEIAKGRKAMKQLAAVFSEDEVRNCTSNHPRRIYKRAEEIGLPESILKDWSEVIGAPKGWEWRRRWTVDGCVFTHGEEASGANSAQRMVDAFQSNVCYGHLHGEGGVRYFKGFARRRWAAQSGCLVFPLHPAFDYGKNAHKQPVLGAIVILDGVPNFKPMGA